MEDGLINEGCEVRSRHGFSGAIITVVRLYVVKCSLPGKFRRRSSALIVLRIWISCAALNINSLNEADLISQSQLMRVYYDEVIVPYEPGLNEAGNRSAKMKLT